MAGWFRILALFSVLEVLGIKVIIMMRMVKDVFFWGILWAILTIAFSALLSKCFHDGDATVIQDLETFKDSRIVSLMIKLMFADFRDEGEYEATPYPKFTSNSGLPLRFCHVSGYAEHADRNAQPDVLRCHEQCKG